MNWDNITWFKPSEFDSPDLLGSGKEKMQYVFVSKLDRIRARCGFPLLVNSGYRTPKHNARVGGVDSSAHTRGYAADIRAKSPRTRDKIVRSAIEEGIKRIGIGANIVHLDADPLLPQDVMWTY